MMMVMMKMVSMPMVNSAEDILDTISLFCPQVSFAKTKEDHSNFTNFWRSRCALTFFLFMLFSSLKRDGAGDDDDHDDDDNDDEDEDEGDNSNVPGYGHHITLLCCFPKSLLRFGTILESKTYKLLWLL